MDRDVQRLEWLDELFAEAVELAGDRRDAFIDRETAGDAELRRELLALLDHDSVSASRIVQAVGGAARWAAIPTDWTGQRFGPYQIVREIGRGGMGIVFEALRDDREVRKTVALKIAPWWRELELLREHFRQERQILAELEHPNIARFLDGGTQDGIPYFAMEYVEGAPITEYVRQRELSVRQRIELFREVCSAVSYAHQSLIVHRDLKPGNILVTHEGAPKLLDFGIAKLLNPLSASGSTMTGTAPWTPDYASPEQVRAQQITTRTDVYSLGLILFEMLTGERAQIADRSSPLALDRSVCESEIPRASSKARGSLFRQLAGDVDTIIAKATAKDPARRYATVAELSDDLARYLAGRPVRARRISPTYRASKFLRRNWLPASAGALAILGLAGGAVGFAWQARVANRSRIIAEQQRDQAAREHAIAEEQRDAAQRAQTRAEESAREANTQRQRAGERTTQMTELAHHAIFDLYNAVATVSGTLEVRRAMLRSTLDYIEKLRAEAGGDPQFQQVLGDTYIRVGDIRGLASQPNLGDLAGAVESYRQGLAILEPLVARNPSNAGFHVTLVGAYNKLSIAARAAGNRAEALQLGGKGLKVARRAVSLAPGSDEALRQIGVMTDQMATVLVENEPDKAEPYARESLDVYTKLAARKKDNSDDLNSVAAIYSTLSSICTRRHDLRGALDYVRKGAEIRERLLKITPEDVRVQRNLLISYGRIGDVLGYATENLGDPKGALGYYRKCVGIAEQMLAKDPRNATARSDLANSQMRAADVLESLEQRQESFEMYSRAAEGFEGLLTPGGSNSATLRVSAAAALNSMSLQSADATQSVGYARRAIQHLTGPPVSNDTTLVTRLQKSRQILAFALARQGDRAGALEETGKAAEILERLSGSVQAAFLGMLPTHFSRVGDTYRALAAHSAAPHEQSLADWRAAKDAYERAVAEWRKTSGSNREDEIAKLDAKIAECTAALARP